MNNSSKQWLNSKIKHEEKIDQYIIYNADALENIEKIFLKIMILIIKQEAHEI